MNEMIGKYVIVRASDAGVFAGTLANKEGGEVTLTNARKLYEWDGACAVEQIAVDGTVNPDSCKFTVTVSEIIIIGVCQILPATEKAEAAIKDVKEWKR